MKISFTTTYKSIHQFNEIEVPSFCVFVGKNGSGKTHILKAIENSHVSVDNIKKDKITYFSFQSFLINNQRPVSARSLEDEKEEAWKIVADFKRGQLRDNIEEIKRHILGRTGKNVKMKALLDSGIFTSGLKLSELDKNTFMLFADYAPDDYRLLDSLSEIFFKYRAKFIKAKLSIEDGGEGKNEEELIELEENSPWSFINKMFESFGLPHRLKAPSFTIGDMIARGNIEYEAKAIYEDFEIGFEDLSSGERILCALAITVFQDQETTKFPQLLLLDEIDASLHPSMVKNLLAVINDVFIKNDCSVILATHSPTTTSLVDEESIFEIKNGNTVNKIEKISQIRAVDILSEGLMNLEKGLVLFDQISSKKLSIITEGDNIGHIEKALKILDPQLLDKIEFIKGAEGGSGKDQLKPLFEFFKLVNHTNSVLFIFDCDVNTASKVEQNNTFIMSLPSIAGNTLVTRGIENMYPMTMFDGFIKTEMDSRGTEKRSFDPTRKKDFLRHVVSSNEPLDFANYQAVIDKINSILT